MGFSTKIYCKFTVEYAVKIMTSQHLAKLGLHARKLVVSRTLCAWALSCSKMKKSPDIWSMAVVDCFYVDLNLACEKLGNEFQHNKIRLAIRTSINGNSELECGPMPNVMVALPNTGGALCSTPQSLADARY